jgi:hypothetical protein
VTSLVSWLRISRREVESIVTSDVNRHSELDRRTVLRGTGAIGALGALPLLATFNQKHRALQKRWTQWQADWLWMEAIAVKRQWEVKPLKIAHRSLGHRRGRTVDGGRGHSNGHDRTECGGDRTRDRHGPGRCHWSTRGLFSGVVAPAKEIGATKERRMGFSRAATPWPDDQFANRTVAS